MLGFECMETIGYWSIVVIMRFSRPSLYIEDIWMVKEYGTTYCKVVSRFKLVSFFCFVITLIIVMTFHSTRGYFGFRWNMFLGKSSFSRSSQLTNRRFWSFTTWLQEVVGLSLMSLWSCVIINLYLSKWSQT